MPTHVKQTDILVSGGGLSGMAAAQAFSRLGFSVTCADPAPPITSRDAPGSDLRSTAFLQPARQLLEDIGLWDRLADSASALRVMRIVDAGGAENVPRLSSDFHSADLGDAPFGWNLPNWMLRREFADAMAQNPQIDFLPGVAVTRIATRSTEARAWLSDGQVVRAQLIVGADGRQSTVRKQAGIGVRTLRYGQKALAFAVSHPLPHDNVSTEIHRSGGPFTLVPLPDHRGSPSSAVVWMERGAEAQRLFDLPTESFNDAISERSCGLLGPLELASRRTLWPIINQIAHRFDAERIALVAEAAHVVPPIGAQGLNMSLKDIDALCGLLRDAPEGIGTPDMLRSYTRLRWPDAKARVTGIDLLNRASMADAQAARDIRMRGLEILHRVRPVRTALMRAGLGAQQDARAG